MYKLHQTSSPRMKKIRGWKNKQRVAVRLSTLDKMPPQLQSIIVRPMVLEDIPKLAKLYRQFWGMPSDTSRMTHLLERLLVRDDYIFLSAIEGDKLIGSVYGIMVEQPYGFCHPFLVLQNFVVDQDHRRKGVASLLLAELEDWGRKKGCLHCDLITYADREAACAFYHDSGFAGIAKGTVGFRKIMIGGKTS